MQSADLTVNGEIVSYTILPVAPSADEVAELNRLKIRVKVNFFNKMDPEQDFENKEFSFFSDYSRSVNLQDIETELIEEIFEQIYLEIFTETVANW